MRVLIAHCRYRERGGEDEVVLSEAELLRSRGHKVELLLEDNRALGRGSAMNVAAEALWSRRAARQMRLAIGRFAPDVVHVHNTLARLSASIYWAAHGARVPVIQTLHNFRLLCAQAMFLRDGRICEDCVGHLPWRGVVRRCYRRSLAQSAVLVASLGVHRWIGTYQDKVTTFIALNDFCRRKFIAGGLPAEKLVVKPNFVDIPRPAFQLRHGGLFVGRLAPEKGIGVLLEALQQRRNHSFEIIGATQPDCARHELSHVRMPGWLDQATLHARMRSASYLVLPSIWYENFPRTLVEAFACGLPVIASRIGALAELVEHGRTGLLFAPGSVRALCDALAWAEAHPARMLQMGRNARVQYERNYTPDANYGQLISIYADAIRQARQERAA